VAKMIRSISPFNSNAFSTTGVKRTFQTLYGDEAYGDVIRFSADCAFPKASDLEMERNNKPAYPTVLVKDFQETGNFFYCWKPMFVPATSVYFESVHDLRFKVVKVPQISSSSPSSVNLNEDIVRFEFKGHFVEGDQLQFSWRGVGYSDCNPENFMGEAYTYNHTYWPAIWFGYDSGVHGITDYTMDELQTCWKSNANNAPDAWIRVKKTTLTQYQFRVNEYDVAANSKCPELNSFDPQYGASTLYETDTQIKFNFKAQAVYPAKKGLVNGKIRIHRGAVKPDGSIVMLETEKLWEKTDLDHTHSPDPFQQGDLICTQTGQCTITLSESANRMKAGEIYFLSFYKDSFAAIDSSVLYYLFNDKTLPAGQTTVYNHLFFCRSFTITPGYDLINGDTFVVYGTDLRKKVIYAKEQSGTIESATFYTKSINLIPRIANTDSKYCTNTPPVMTVALADVQDSMFTVTNLELFGCNEGDLFADIVMTRGIISSMGEYSHLREDRIYDVQLGRIGCHSSCKSCNGTSANECEICADSSHFLYMGTCYSQCPSPADNYLTFIKVYQGNKYEQLTCLKECPYGYYADAETLECVECNPDCQTCNSSTIASCLSCNPIKYLLNGICVSECPSPHHSNNYTDYTCNQLSSPTYLKVKIQSLGYKNRIPKDIQAYLKAEIDNTGGGEVLTVVWEQLEPEPTVDEMVIFPKTVDGDLDNKQAVIKLKMSAFNFLASSQVVKVKVTVTNSAGDIAYDIYEFYLNDPPVVGTLTSTVTGGSGASGTALTSLYHLKLSDWYDSSDDFSQQLEFSVRLMVDSVPYTLTDLTSAEDLYLHLPVLSN